jgi:two-component system sensor histidine kinase HydH
MEGYAPLQNAQESPFAVVAVEADARFFGGLRRLRNMLVGIGGLSVLLLVGLGLFLVRMEASLGRAEAAVQRAETLAAMGRMAAGIAHEIRNPLGIIQATAARLKKRYDNPAQPDEKFDYIADEVERLNAIVTGYLNFAKEEESRLEPLDLVPVLHRTLRLMGPELEGPGVALEVETPETCTVRGDAQRLQQVMMNLVLNSVQAMPQGGRLRVQLSNDNGGAQLSFSDSGPGIPAGVRERLFEPFFTTKAQGSGLGLTVARRIVEQHGGRITLAEAELGGARVEISLPGA